eukprot:COSAG01_NODE_1670_length_9556_cov_4.917733_3_plen_304_part_00
MSHRTFSSPSLGVPVGYCIYLPPGYGEVVEQQRRYPVVYYLHGGRPGNELAGAHVVSHVADAMERGTVPPAIYVFVNGGPVSHYNYAHASVYGDAGRGEDVFVDELLPHVDSHYHTISARHGRALEGFSQGGRGVLRYAFSRPDLWCSAAPGGAGFGFEKACALNAGVEVASLEPAEVTLRHISGRVELTPQPDTARKGSLLGVGEDAAHAGRQFQPGYDAYTLARSYAAHTMEDERRGLRLQFHCGMQCFNFLNNLAYFSFLDELGLQYSTVLTWGAGHDVSTIYERNGHDIMLFHARNFRI